MVWTATVTALLMKVVLHALTQMGTVVVMSKTVRRSRQTNRLIYPKFAATVWTIIVMGRLTRAVLSFAISMTQPAVNPVAVLHPTPSLPMMAVLRQLIQDIVPGLPAC